MRVEARVKKVYWLLTWFCHFDTDSPEWPGISGDPEPCGWTRQPAPWTWADCPRQSSNLKHVVVLVAGLHFKLHKEKKMHKGVLKFLCRWLLPLNLDLIKISYSESSPAASLSQSAFISWGAVRGTAPRWEGRCNSHCVGVCCDDGAENLVILVRINLLLRLNMHYFESMGGVMRFLKTLNFAL